MKTTAVEYLEKRIAPANIFVTNLNDDLNAGSLRKAIADANLTPAPDTIIFKPTAFGTIFLGGTQLDITAPLTIKGPGAGKAIISGNDTSRIFNVDNADAAEDAPFALSGLALTKGNATGGIGGAIFSTESLTVKDCILSSNTADFGGGGIFLVNTALNKVLITITTITITNSTITATSGGGGAFFGLGVNTKDVRGGAQGVIKSGNSRVPPSIPPHGATHCRVRLPPFLVRA